MLCSFLKIAALVAVPMLRVEIAGEQDSKPKYSAVDVQEKTESNRRQEEVEQGPGRSSAMPAIVDPTVVEQQDNLSINAPAELVRQKIEEAHDIEQKWKIKMEQWALRSGIDSIQEEEIVKIRDEAVADLECWTNQNERVSLLLAENKLEATRERLFSILATAANQAMQQAQGVIDFCDTASSVSKRNTLAFAQSSFNTSAATSPLTSKSRPTSEPSLFSPSEKLAQLVAAVHAAANRSQKCNSFEMLDERFRQSLKNWTERENARLKHETAIKEHKKLIEELALQQSIHDNINPETMLAAKVSRCARIGSYIFGCINTPCFNVAAFFTGAAGVADEVNKEIIDHPLHRAEANEKRAAAVEEKNRKDFENMQMEAPEFHQETERLEQEARIHEKNEIMELAKKIVPPLAGDDEEVWNQWAEGIVEIANFNPFWAEILARHGQQDRDWVLEQITSAWEQKVEHLERYVAQLKNKESLEQKEKKKLGDEAVRTIREAEAVNKIVSEYQQQIKTLTQDAALARQNLVDANQVLNVLEQTPIVSEKEVSGEESAKGIASMDASLGAVSQQWTRVKELKEKLKELEAQLEEVKLQCHKQEPIAAAKTIVLNTSVRRYQKYAERLDRNIERAIARLEANRLAGESILNLPGEVPFQEMIVSIEGALGASGYLPVLEEMPSSRQQRLHSSPEDFLPSAADIVEERQQVLRLGVEEKDDDSIPSPSKEDVLRRRRNSLVATGKVSSEFEFPSISRLSEKSFEYLQKLHHSVDSEEKKEEERSSSGDSIFRTVLSLKMPAEVHSEDGDVGLALTPNCETVMQQQSLVMDARNQAVRKSAEEALPDWRKAITQAGNLMVTYQQVIEANEQAVTSLAREVAAQQGGETAPQATRRTMLIANLEQAKEKKSDWTIKLCSYKADQAGDLAIYEATLPTVGIGSHQQILKRVQEAVEAYGALKELCRKMLREHPAISPALQSSWMKLLEETVQDEQHWRAKRSLLGGKSNTPQETLKGYSPLTTGKDFKDSL